MTQNSGIPAVVLGLSGNGLGVARSLGRRGVHVVAVNEGGRDVNASSRYVREIWPFEGSDDELVAALLERGPSFHERPVLFPITDSCVLSVARSLDELRAHYRIGMPAGDLVRRTLCKTGFAEMAEEMGLPVPRSFFVRKQNQMQEVADAVRYPCILKPEYRSRAYVCHSGGKAFLADNRAELLTRYADFSEFAPEVVVQEYVPGGDGDVLFCFQYYDADHRPLVTLSGRKIRQWPPLCGSAASCEVRNLPDLEALSTDFFRAIGYVGPCSMECKRDPRDGTLKVIEPTIGRTDWNNGFAECNGVPLPYIAYCDLAGLAQPRWRRTRIARRWIRWSADFAAAKHARRNKEIGLAGWLWSIRPPWGWSRWCWDDPRPTLSAFFGRVRRKVRKLLRLPLRSSNGTAAEEGAEGDAGVQ